MQSMSDRYKAFWLGLFILICIALLTWLLLFLRPSVGDNRQVLRIRFSNIEKIAIGTRVTYGGKAVGEVVQINEIFDARSHPSDVNGVPFIYEIVARVDSRVKIYSCDDILFSTSGLLGEKTIAIIPKMPLPSCPNPQLIKCGEVLYARSTDQLQQALDKVLGVADTVNDAMILVANFIRENNEEFKLTLQSMRQASGNLNDITLQITQGQGSFGRFIYDDHFYMKMMNTMSHFDRLVTTLNNYGLFYQFSTRWQRERRWRECCCDPCDVYNYFNTELSTISQSIDRLNEAQERAKCEQITIDTSCLLDKINELIDKVKDLQCQN